MSETNPCGNFHVGLAHPRSDVGAFRPSGGMARRSGQVLQFIAFAKLTENGLLTVHPEAGQIDLTANFNVQNVEILNSFWSPFSPAFDWVALGRMDGVDKLMKIKRKFIELAVALVDIYLIEPSFESNIEGNNAVYLSLSRWTDLGLKTVMASSTGTVHDELAEKGIILRRIYWVLAGGGADVVVLTQSENLENMAISKLQTVIRGRYQTRFHILYPMRSLEVLRAKLGSGSD
jgi:uncharacterized protein with GYD domain